MSDNIISEIFDAKIAHNLTEDEERALISSAQGGSEEAMETLLRTYAGLLNSAARRAHVDADAEDVRAEAMLAFIEAVHAFNPDTHRRLGAIAPSYIKEGLSALSASASGFTVPERTLKRFWSILRKADGNVYEALAIAPDHAMATDTFLAVLHAVRETGSIDALTEWADTGQVPAAWIDSAAALTGPVRTTERIVEEARLIETAFTAVDTLENDVVRLAYGFADYDPQVDAEIGHRLGFSRQKTQRIRHGALDKMRSALGA